MADNGNPTPGSEAGAKISDTKVGCTQMAPAKPKQPEQPVRH